MSNKKWSNATKIKIVLEVLKETSTLSEICKKYAVAPSQIHVWKKQFQENSEAVFEKKSAAMKELEAQCKQKSKNEKHLYQKIGQLTIERDFLKKNLARFPEYFDKDL